MQVAQKTGNMRVFKFGGASVRNPESVRNVARIIRDHHGTSPLVVVLSAMGKTTNALEELCALFMSGDTPNMETKYEEIRSFHMHIARGLFSDPDHPVFQVLEQTFYQLYYYITAPPGDNYNYEYDRIVSSGEMVSTRILSMYLNEVGLPNRLFPAQKLIITDASFRDARVDWVMSSRAIQEQLGWAFREDPGEDLPPLVITQGFIGGTPQGFTTTLGREGSDFTAAIVAWAMQAREVVIWKDVPGLLNADPKIMEQAVLLPNISYQEAIELAYYGATVIHPKTLKPLLNKKIPLKVKSFHDPEMPGSLIDHHEAHDNQIPSYIFKDNQVLVSIFPKDFSFIAEENLARLFADFARHGVKMNLMQNSAISFSACFDYDRIKTPALLRDLRKMFSVKYNKNLELITVRHYQRACMEKLTKDKEVVMEQKNRTTLQVIVRGNR